MAIQLVSRFFYGRRVAAVYKSVYCAYCLLRVVRGMRHGNCVVARDLAEYDRDVIMMALKTRG